MTFDAGNPKDVKDAKQRAKNADQVFAEDMAWMLDSIRGRRILWRLLEASGIRTAVLPTDALSMAFREGGRNLGLMVQSWIEENDPDWLAMIVKEHTDG